MVVQRLPLCLPPVHHVRCFHQFYRCHHSPPMARLPILPSGEEKPGAGDTRVAHAHHTLLQRERRRTAQIS